MKNYELTYLISTNIPEEEAKQIQTKISSFIQTEEGSLIEERPVFKRRLAYYVKKQIQAFEVTVNFHFNPEKIALLEKTIKAEKEILRYLILIKIPTHKTKPARTLKKSKITKLEKEKKVNLDEIETKLNEILEE